jgi:hypothetical protein
VHPAGKSRHKLFTIAHDGSKLAALVFPTVFDSLQLSFQAAAIVFRTRSGRIKDAARAPRHLRGLKEPLFGLLEGFDFWIRGTGSSRRYGPCVHPHRVLLASALKDTTVRFIPAIGADHRAHLIA